MNRALWTQLLSPPSPSRVFASGAKGLWLYPQDLSLTFQDSGATVNGAVDSQAGKMMDRSGRGNHLSQTTDGLRPTLKLEGGVYSYRWDGVDDEIGATPFPTGTLAASTDVFAAIKRNGGGGAILAQQNAVGSNFFGVWEASAGDPHSGVGTSVTYYVNGVSAGTTRTSLASATPVGSWVVFEVHDLDLSAWTGFRMGAYGAGYVLHADIAGLVVCASQTDAMRMNIRRWLAKQARISL